MSYLRARQVDETLASTTPGPIIAADKRHEFWGFIKYLGLDEYMGCAQTCFVARDPQLSCTHSGQVTSHGLGADGRTAIADLPMSSGEIHYYKVHLQKLGDPLAKLFLGVGKKVDMSTGDKVPDTSIYGWGSPASAVKKGVSSAETSLLQWQPEDFVCLKVDLQNGCLTLTNSRATMPLKMLLSIDDKDCLALLVTLYGHGQQVQLVPIEVEDRSCLALGDRIQCD